MSDKFRQRKSHDSKYGHRYEASSSNSDRPPPGLRGKQIGLWYANRNRLKRAAGTSSLDQEASLKRKEEKLELRQKATDKKPLATIKLSDNKKSHIDSLLHIKSDSLMDTDDIDTNFKSEFLRHIGGSIIDKLNSSINESIINKDEKLDKVFYGELEGKHGLSSYEKMLNVRKKLPSMSMREEILNLINNNQIVVISGETGCGKTTQVAQFILDDHIEHMKGSVCKIVCTQPRRISAISVAERVAEERDEKLGHSVGFQIRLEKVAPRDKGSILYCTTGVLLKFMESDPSLASVSHLIIDEIHERDVISDFLITVLKDVIRFRKDLKIILMSATLNAEAFSRYYNNAPHINIPGFTYPVEEYFLEDVLQKTRFVFEESNTPIWIQKKNREETEAILKDRTDYVEPYIRKLQSENLYDRHVFNELRKPESEKLNVKLIFALLKYICQKEKINGAILVFVTGFAEIQGLMKLMEQSYQFPSYKYKIFPLHSQLPTTEQRQIFLPAPQGMTKIIIATNIAETSITIDDVTVVIDCGFIKMSNVDPQTGIETLQPERVTWANASQRKGRAGRVQAGVCYHLISKVRYEMLDRFQKPEVLRKRLESVILQLKMLQLGKAQEFLSRLMDPPESISVTNSLTLLSRLGALDEDEALTPLGLHMAKLPVQAQCAKMLIMGALFNCLDPVLSVAAALDFKDGFQLSATDQGAADRAKDRLANRCNSDHLVMHFAIRGFETASNPSGFCREYFLSAPILRLLTDMRKQFATLLYDMKFIADPNPRNKANNLNSNNLSLVKAVICSGLYPNVAIMKTNKLGKPLFLRSVLHERMKFHPKSILCRAVAVTNSLVVYYQRLKSSSLYIHDATIVYPLPLVFFGDQFCRIHESDFSGVSINGTMRFRCSESTSAVIAKLRNRINSILEHKASHPGPIDWTVPSSEVMVLRAIMEMITSEDMEDLDLSDYEDD